MKSSTIIASSFLALTLAFNAQALASNRALTLAEYKTAVSKVYENQMTQVQSMNGELRSIKKELKMISQNIDSKIQQKMSERSDGALSEIIYDFKTQFSRIIEVRGNLNLATLSQQAAEKKNEIILDSNGVSSFMAKNERILKLDDYQAGTSVLLMISDLEKKKYDINLRTDNAVNTILFKLNGQNINTHYKSNSNMDEEATAAALRALKQDIEQVIRSL